MNQVTNKAKFNQSIVRTWKRIKRLPEAKKIKFIKKYKTRILGRII